ncbi:FtsH protease activity modulator HflK [Paenibacillus soyae]|uniref:Protein HflK n=1 Tax=Paenibacillus soyae TaxID=2969249 RepID=A0A9X2SAM6_9BACL|nr:FtsH protease activity modulator HflK [Paenibacillus soyae]MCR2806150.1 FtsH protease activity modulator HflK [Paenibacillus soyae]
MNQDPQPNPSPNPNRKPPELKPGTVKKLVIGIAAAIVLIYLGSTSFYTVQEQERAAVMTFGKYSHETTSGLHFKWPSPIQQVIVVPAELTQHITIGYRQNGNDITPVEEEAIMITGDENIVSADAVVTWKISNIQSYLYNISNPEQFLRNATGASIRSVIGSQKLDYAITDGKTEIQDQVRERLIELQARYDTGIQIIDLKFQDIEPPGGEVEDAFRAVTNAREEKNTKINNAAKYENDRIPKARGEAQALLEHAEAEKKSRILNAEGDVAKFNAIYAEYAKNPGVTESRLILETLEKILPGAKIFITNSGSDTVNYLPLNELLKNNASSASSNADTSPAPQGGNEQQ